MCGHDFFPPNRFCSSNKISDFCGKSGPNFFKLPLFLLLVILLMKTIMFFDRYICHDVKSEFYRNVSPLAAVGGSHRQICTAGVGTLVNEEPRFGLLAAVLFIKARDSRLSSRMNLTGMNASHREYDLGVGAPFHVRTSITRRCDTSAVSESELLSTHEHA